jgi:hypothetical protein
MNLLTAKPAAIPAHLAEHLASRSRPLSLQELMDEVGLPVSRATMFRYLVAARDQGLVIMSGQARRSVWTATHGPRLAVLRQQLALPVEKRPVVAYEEGFVDEYVPNKTTYLTSDQIKRLHDQCKPGSAAFATLSPHDRSLFMCGLSFASSRLEGNPYDLAATEKLIEMGQEKIGASPTETTMVLNHHEAVRYLVDNIHFPRLKNDVTVSTGDVKSLHSLLSAYLLKDPMMCGCIRHSAVRIKDSSYVPLAFREHIERAFTALIDKARLIEDPYEQAFFLLVHIPYLQPFEDCNKRTARVACNIPLLKSGVVPMSWMDVDHHAYIEGTLGVYERNNTSLLAEVFVDGYIRASERFNVMQRSCEPNETLVRYRSEIKATVRSVVLGGDVDVSDEVAPADLDEFNLLVQQELKQIEALSPGALIRFKLTENDAKAWMAHLPVFSAGENVQRERQRA